MITTIHILLNQKEGQGLDNRIKKVKVWSTKLQTKALRFFSIVLLLVAT